MCYLLQYVQLQEYSCFGVIMTLKEKKSESAPMYVIMLANIHMHLCIPSAVYRVYAQSTWGVHVVRICIIIMYEYDIGCDELYRGPIALVQSNGNK